MASNISKTTQSLSGAEDMRNQTKLMMQPYANWEEYLTPAPLSIAIMGELVFISSVTDFSINKNPPKDGYKYIRYPESFRACLMQVCNSGWTAFNEAHTSMDQIRLHTAQVPDYMKMAVKILFNDDDEVVKAHLPDQLKNIQVIADECLKLSTETEKHFMNVIRIIQELLEACVNAEHFYGEELKKVQKKIEENKLKEQSAQAAKERMAKMMKATEKELKEAHERYNKAMDSLPSAMSMMTLDIVGGLAQSVSGLINGVAHLITHPVRNACVAATKISETVVHIKGKQSVGDEVDEILSCCKSGEILQCVQDILVHMNVTDRSGEIDWKKLYDQKEKTTNTNISAEHLQRIIDELGQINDCKGKSDAQVLCMSGIRICDQLAKHAPVGKCEKDINSKIVDDVFKLIDLVRVFDSKSKATTKSPAISPKPPMMYKNENKSGNSLSQQATDNARFAIEQGRTQLNRTTETYEKCVENLEKNEKELTEILISMQNCDLKEMDFNTTIEMLVKGMDAMGRVKEQWEKMVRFFQMVSNLVKTSLNTTLKNFVSASEKTQALSYNAKLFSKDLLYTQAFKACDIASLVHMISGTYTEISNKYLMDRVSSLGKLMVMDKSKPEFELERHKLHDSCDKAQKGILELVLKNKEEFEKKSTARLERIDRELLAILPAAPPEEIKKMQEAVQAGFSEEEAESYY